MKKIGLSILCGAFALLSNAQDVLTIGDENISLEEFKTVFYKNNNNTEVTREYLDEYMQLFINFKLKVKQAEELGLDTVAAFKSELEGYKKQLAKPYLKNKEFDENMLTEAYERMQFDINASHILIAVNENASAKEEKEAYDKILKIRTEIVNNDISFSDAAKKNSDDKSALNNGGNLSYFTAFMMVYDFESAAYNTKVGEISMPVRTKYGYHILKVEDKRKAAGEVQVAHIMFKSGQGADERKLNEAKDNIYKVTDLLANGEEFADVAERFSEDRTTAVKGGKLPKFGVGKMVPEFEHVAFNLNEIGEISKPFRTDYGWHIVTLLEKNEIPSFDDMKAELRRKIERDSRGDLSKQALYAKLHDTYKVVNKPSVYTAFRKGAANPVSLGKYNDLARNSNTLFTIDGKSYSVNSFANYIFSNQKEGSDIDELYENYVNEELLAYEESQLEVKYPEYKALLNEYREGILLFDLTNTVVWTKAVEDSIGLQKYFDANITNYTWSERVDATVYTCIDLATAKQVKRAIYKKHRGSITDAEILEKSNKDAALSLTVLSNKFSKGDNEYVDVVEWKKGIASDIKTKDGSYILVDIHEVLPAGEKKLEETRGKVISDYQNSLEKSWIENLRKENTFKVHREVLYSLIK